MSDPVTEDTGTKNAIYLIVHDAVQATTVDKKIELRDRYEIALEVTAQLFDAGFRLPVVALRGDTK